MTSSGVPTTGQSVGEQWLICGECGALKREADWPVLNEGSGVEPLLKCPDCGHVFFDPEETIWGGTRDEMERELKAQLADPVMAEHWGLPKAAIAR